MAGYLLAVVLSSLSTVCFGQQTLTDGPLAAPAASPMLGNDAIVRMSKAGLDASLLLQLIRTQPGRYQTSPDDLIRLKEAGVTSSVISAMAAHDSGLSERLPAASLTVAPLSPETDEQGVYHKNAEGRWVLVKPELVRYKSGGWAKSTLTNNIVKKDRNGEVSGRQAELVLKPGEELLVLAPPNVDAVEYQLLRFRLHSGSREFRASTGGVFNSHDGTDRDQVPVTPTRVAPRIFSLTIPPTIGSGEFGVLPPGGASVPGIAFAGKMYTFAVTVDR